MSDVAGADYDEFSLFPDNAAEVGLAYEAPVVRRQFVEVAPGRSLSALVWGDRPPELVLIHGGGQNAHTWDTVALALALPLVALDLPGHGHSDRPGDDHVLDLTAWAADVAVAIERLAPTSRLVVGMSLGGSTAVALAAARPDLAPKVLLVDVTPGVTREKSADIAAFLAGPESYASFDEILQRTIRFNPTRSESSLRRGVLHNAVQRDDGTWTWRHQLGRPVDAGGLAMEPVDARSRWDQLEGLAPRVLLVRGALSPVVDDADEAEFRRRRPTDQVVTVAGAGHSIQGDQPLELARIISAFLGAD